MRLKNDEIKNVWFIGINSSYIHTNPAIRALAQKAGANWTEFNINQHKDFVLKKIYNLAPDVAAFSCYIWNIEYVLEIAENLKKILPQVKILLGGPEVSYDPITKMESCAFIDGIICGEGEDVMRDAISALYGYELTNGVLIRRESKITGTAFYNTVSNLDTLNAPFENYRYDPNKIFYYESSRGCPFSCAYCLSGDNVRLRYKSLDKVYGDLDTFAANNVRLIKFVDRTFNADRERARKIFEYIIRNDKFEKCRFHFEIGLDLLDENTLDLLTGEKARRLQFEAGIQTCNGAVLNIISRKTNIKKSLKNANYITKNTNAELHLDLIAGLPGENFESFKTSFNKVYEIGATNIQLGFLKLLKGSSLRNETDKHGIVYREKPPYEVLSTFCISAKELFVLKEISELINRYYNSDRARRGLNYLTSRLNFDAFEFFLGLSEFANKRNSENRPLSAADQFRLLMDYTEPLLNQKEYSEFLTELKKDYLSVKIKGAMPERLALL